MATSPFGGDALLAFALGNQLARESNYSHVQPEHISLAMLKRPEGRLPSLASGLYLDLSKMRQQLQNALRPGGGPSSSGKLPTSAAAEQIVKLAVSEGQRLGHAVTGSEHLLLAMLLHPTQPAAGVLTATGVTTEDVLRSIARLDTSPNVVSVGGAPQVLTMQRRAAELRQQVEDWRECNDTRALVETVQAAAERQGISPADNVKLKVWLQLASSRVERLDPIRQILSHRPD